MSCENCRLKEADKELTAAIKKAREDAEEKNQAIAVIKTETGYENREAFAAYREGLGPLIVQVVSRYNSTTA